MVGAEKRSSFQWELGYYLSDQEMLTDDWITTVPVIRKEMHLVCLLEANHGGGIRKYECVYE